MFHAPTPAHQQHGNLPHVRSQRHTATSAVSPLHHPMVIPITSMTPHRATDPALYAANPVHHVPAMQTISSGRPAYPAPIRYPLNGHSMRTTHPPQMSTGAGSVYNHHHPTHVPSDRMPFLVEHTPLPSHSRIFKPLVIPRFVLVVPRQPVGHRVPFEPSPRAIVTTPRALPQSYVQAQIPDNVHPHVHPHPEHRTPRRSMPVTSTKPPILKRTRFSDEVEIHWLDVDELDRVDGSPNGPTKLRKVHHHTASSHA